MPVAHDVLVSLHNAARDDLALEQCTIIRPQTLVSLIEEVMALRLVWSEEERARAIRAVQIVVGARDEADL